MRSLYAFLFLFLAGTKAAQASDHAMPFMEYLDQDNLVHLSWGFDYLQENITFKLVVNTTGWVGLGFSPNGGMAGADIVIGGLGPEGAYFADYHARGKFKPLLDEEQSYTLLSMEESEGQTTMIFQRPIKSCDPYDLQITTQPMKLIYARGKTDEIAYHGALRGTKEVNLLNYRQRTTVANSSYINATMDNFTVPSVHSYYHCKIMKLPALNTKHHIQLIEPVIVNLDLVHHILLHRCPSDVTEAYEYQCYTGDEGDACLEVVAGWAVGGRGFELPEGTGIPVGGEDNDLFYMLQIHYDNPNNQTGRTDSSGLKLYYSPVGQHQYSDVGIMTTGLLSLSSLEYTIPPKASQFHSYGVCNTSIFSEILNHMPDLQVFAVLLHTHLTGVKIRVGHYRDGKQIDFLALDENYDFNMQQITNLGTIKTIKQGDEIAVECTYNTTNRTEGTKLGLATTNEMCLAFLFYYPAINISSCLSRPNTKHPLMGTGYQMFEGNPTPDPEKIDEYEKLLLSVPQIHMAADENYEYAIYKQGTVRKMMETPKVPCNDTSRLCTSWTLNPAGMILLLLWFALY